MFLHVFWVLFLLVLICAFFVCPVEVLSKYFQSKTWLILFSSTSRRCRSLWRRRSRSASVCSNDLRRWMWKRKLCFGRPPSKKITVWLTSTTKMPMKSWCFFCTITLLFFITLIILHALTILLWLDWIGNNRPMIRKGKRLKRWNQRTKSQPFFLQQCNFVFTVWYHFHSKLKHGRSILAN